MGPLTILHGMALAAVVAPISPPSAEHLLVTPAVADYNLPAARPSVVVTPNSISSTNASLPKLPTAVAIDDALQMPKLTFRDGGVMEIGGGGLKFDWRF